jgi:predicted negative regulator of RcsB-dependent stress response
LPAATELLSEKGPQAAFSSELGDRELEDYLSEKEQWESIKVWIKVNGLWIVAGIAVGAALLAGWQWYQDHGDQVGVAASTKYEEILKAFERNDRTQAFVLLGDLGRDYPSSPYLDQARLLAARSYVDAGQLDKASGELQAVAEHSKDAELAMIARLRLARVQIAQQKAGLAIVTLSGVQPGAFAPQYHEILGDAYDAKGDKSAALKEYMSAKVGDLRGAGSGPGDELDLKIADLSAGTAAAPPATAAVSPATAATSK